MVRACRPERIRQIEMIIAKISPAAKVMGDFLFLINCKFYIDNLSFLLYYK